MTARSWGHVSRPLLLAMVLSGLLWGWRRSDAPRGSEAQDTLAELLARDHGIVLEPESILSPGLDAPLEPSARARDVYLFGTVPPSTERDLYLATVRVARGGRVIDVGDLRNLTRTPFADESLLTAAGPFVICKVSVHGQLQSLLLLDDRGDERRAEEGVSLLQRTLLALTNLQQTGRSRGVGMRLFAFESSPEKVSARFEQGRRFVELDLSGAEPSTGSAGERPAQSWRVRINPETGQVLAGAETLSHEPRGWSEAHISHWLVNTVRNFEAVGPRPIALLEKWVFTAQDRVEQWAFAAGLMDANDIAEEVGAPSLTVLSDAQGTDSRWPPPPVVPLVTPAQPGEGQWVPLRSPWLLRWPDAPAAFYKTVVRTDPSRPRSAVVLAAMDMRQLDLGMVGGLQTPRSATGIRGRGYIPREPGLLSRVVAAFNGGFQTAHGAFGMSVAGRIILPPKNAAATLAVRTDGTLALGTWNNSMDVPKDIHSFRQNLPPLVADGQWNPTRRKRWGGTVSDLDQVNTSRSAVGFRGPHTLYYVWGRSTSAKELGRVLNAAGVEYGMHLDMNPYHTGFHLLGLDPDALDSRKHFQYFLNQPLSPKQEFDPRRYVQRNSKDFFFLTLRSRFHDRLPGLPAGYGKWRPLLRPDITDGFIPRLAISQGSNSTGVDMVVAFDLANVGSSLHRGTGESRALDGLGKGRSDAAKEVSRLVAALDLGSVQSSAPVGLVSGGRIHWPPVRALPALTIDAANRLSITRKIGSAKTYQGLRQLRPMLLDGRRILAGSGGRLHVFAQDAAGAAYYITGQDEEAIVEVLDAVGARDALLLPDVVGRGSALRLVRDDGQGVVELWDPLTGRTYPLTQWSPRGSQLLLSSAPEPDRTRRLRLEDVVLSKEEARRQRKERARIAEMRAALRQVANAQYRAYIEKVQARREARRQAAGTP